MGKLFYVIGKSSTGKDSIAKMLLEDKDLGLSEIIQYTTRPKRDGEEEGREYHFISNETAERFDAEGRIIELRAYHTVHGLWQYMMVDDGSIDLTKRSYLAVGTVEAYGKLCRHFPEEAVVPIYIDVETGERLYRAVLRERKSEHPKYAELCRRFLADEADFSDEHLRAAGLMDENGVIRNRIENGDLETCVAEIRALILKETDERQ